MKVQGEQSLPLEPAAAWDLLLDADTLAQAMPGCESLVPVGPDEYEMKMKLAVSSIQGLFSGKIRIEDKNPPHGYRLRVEGQGKLGHLRGTGLLSLSPDAEGTRLAYSGDVQVGGLLASVGERMLDMTTKMLIKRFFASLLEQSQDYSTRNPS